jgi:hypothetical protein
MAALDVDDCDIQTDYFSTTTAALVILGHSTHKRNIFSELRKHADRIPETAHLITPNPETEHRENYSGGAGYYIKAEGPYKTGWKLYKRTKYGDFWPDDLYAAMAKRCIFT